MAAFTRPDVYVQERPAAEGPIDPPSLGYGGMQAVTEKGPVGVPVRSLNFADWSRVFGSYEVRSDAAYEAKAFFDEGGAELITCRVAHYTDLQDPDSFAGGTANRTVNTGGVAATAAAKDSAAIGPFNLEPGWDVNIDVDNSGPAAATFLATPASTAGAGLAIVDLTGDTLLVEMDNDGDVQTITFVGTEASAADVAATINAQLQGGHAEVNGGEVDIYSDLEGTDSEVDIQGGTALAEIGHSIGTSIGGGNVANIDAVTAAEVKAVVEGDIAGITLTVNADQTIRWVSDTVGAASELDFQAGTANAALGLSVEVLTGSAAGGTQPTLQLESGFQGTLSPGVRGNELEARVIRAPQHASQGAGNDLAADITALDTEFQVTTLQGIAQGSVLRLQDGATEEYVEVLAVRTDVVAGSALFYVEATGPITNPFAASSATIESTEFDIEVYDKNTLVETWEGLSMLDTADNYVETIINDDVIGSQYVVVTDLDAPIGLGGDQPATDAAKVALTGGTDETAGLVQADWIGDPLGGTGLYAFDSVREFMPLCSVGENSPGLFHSGVLYAQNRLFFEYIGAVTLGSDATAAINYRQNQLGIDSSYGALYAGGMSVVDLAGSGKDPRRSIQGLGALMGLRSRVDNLPAPDGGPWQAPAGEGDYGQLRSALNVADDYNDTDHGRMNAAGINTIRKFGRTSPVLVWGARTLATSSKAFRYINTRRQFQYFEKAVADGTRYGVFRNNDFRLWSRLRDSVVDFLSAAHKDRAFPGRTEEESFFVQIGVSEGTMDQSNIDNGETIGEIGLAPHKPSEFIIWRFSQFEGGVTVEELG